MAPALQAQITGVVRDSQTQAPLSGAIVRIQKHTPFAMTAVDGSFSLADSGSFPLTITAARHGHYIGSVTLLSLSGPVTIELDPLNLTNSVPPPAFNAPVECQSCHPDIYDTWLGSPMQKTGLNTWVFDLYDGTGTAGGSNGFVYKRDSIHRTTSPNSDCSACHSPVHWLADIENNGMGDFHNPNPDMRRGVQCEVCHRVADVDINQTYMPGVQPQSFHLVRNASSLEFGPIDDSTYEQGIMRPAYNPQLKAQLCSACHEDNVDHDGDGEFNDPGSLPHETTFTEWRAWKLLNAGNTEACVDCHMPALDTDGFCIFVKGRPGVGRSHNIRGTTPDFLENALNLDVAVSHDLGSLTVAVNLSNDQTGHAVPSGVVVRNVILLVIAKNQQGDRLTMLQGDTVDEVGGIGDFDSGDYAGHPGYAFYRNMSDGTNERIFYTDAQTIVSDTRLQPGASYVQNFTFAYAGADPVDIDVKVLYRRAFRDFVLVKGWTETGHGEPLADIQAPHFGHVMERFQAQADPCAERDLNGGGVTLSDLYALAPQWLGPAPFGEGDTDIRHFIATANCLQNSRPTRAAVRQVKKGPREAPKVRK